MGTVISERHLARIQAMLESSRSGAVLTGGQRLSGKSDLDGFDFDGGSFFPPTVIADIATSDPLWQEEIFGPVVVAKRFSVSLHGNHDLVFDEDDFQLMCCVDGG
jgi:acyl-CoA reductase-like NAD-dependent aldehyde dehydrogenase